MQSGKDPVALGKITGEAYHANPVFAKHRQWEEYDHYLSHYLNVQISGEFPHGKALLMCWAWSRNHRSCIQTHTFRVGAVPWRINFSTVNEIRGMQVCSINIFPDMLHPYCYCICILHSTEVSIFWPGLCLWEEYLEFELRKQIGCKIAIWT